MNNGRDCPHGRQVGKCDTCDLIKAELELQKVQAERDALAAQLVALNKLHSDLTNADMVLDDGEHSGYLITSEQLEDMEHYLSEPILCLAAHDAEVGAKAIEQAVTYLSESIPDKSHESVIFKDRYVYISNKYLREYAAKVRKGGEA